MYVLDLLLCCLVLLSVTVALISMVYVWIHGLAHVDESCCGLGKKLFWVSVMFAFGWAGAAIYWAVGSSRRRNEPLAASN